MNNETNINTNNADNNLPVENNIQSTTEEVQPVFNNTTPVQNQTNTMQSSMPAQANYTTQSTQPVIQNNVQTPSPELQIQNQFQNIPTVDQTKEQFINNVQSINQRQKEEKKEPNPLILVGILFGVVLISIYFLFPLLDKYI